MLQLFCRVNVPLMVGALVLQSKHGAKVLPLKLQSVLAGAYACVALGVVRISRPGVDRYADLFLQHLPERKYYLA